MDMFQTGRYLHRFKMIGFFIKLNVWIAIFDNSFSLKLV
jgi:hypothetical protein